MIIEDKVCAVGKARGSKQGNCSPAKGELEGARQAGASRVQQNKNIASAIS